MWAGLNLWHPGIKFIEKQKLKKEMSWKAKQANCCKTEYYAIVFFNLLYCSIIVGSQNCVWN